MLSESEVCVCVCHKQCMGQQEQQQQQQIAHYSCTKKSERCWRIWNWGSIQQCTHALGEMDNILRLRKPSWTRREMTVLLYKMKIGIFLYFCILIFQSSLYRLETTVPVNQYTSHLIDSLSSNLIDNYLIQKWSDSYIDAIMNLFTRGCGELIWI